MSDFSINSYDKKKYLAINLGKLDGYMESFTSPTGSMYYNLWKRDYQNARNKLLSHVVINSEPYENLYKINYYSRG